MATATKAPEDRQLRLTPKEWRAVDELRRERPLSEIARDLGFTEEQVLCLYHRYLRYRRATRYDGSSECEALAREAHLDRLEVLMERYFPHAAAGNARAALIVLNIMTRQARLQALDKQPAPPNPQGEPADMGAEQLIEEAERHGVTVDAGTRGLILGYRADFDEDEPRSAG